MRDLRTRLAALAVIAGILAGIGGSVFAQGSHPRCVARQHDCERPARIVSCCCGDAGTSRDSGAPAQARVEIAPLTAATPTLPQLDALTSSEHPAAAVHTSPPGLALLDFPTLFATLLI